MPRRISPSPSRGRPGEAHRTSAGRRAPSPAEDLISAGSVSVRWTSPGRPFDVVVLPADAHAADVVDRRCRCRRGPRRPAGRRPRRRCRRRSRRRARAESSVSACQSGPDGAGVGDRGADPLQAAVGVGDGALLLGEGLGREVDVGVLGAGGAEHRDAEGEVGGADRASPSPRGRRSRGPGRRPRGSAPRARRTRAPRGSRRPSGPAATCAEARAERPRRSRPRGGRGRWRSAGPRRGRRPPCRRGRARRRARAAHGAASAPVVAGEHPLAPDDDDRAGVAQRGGEAVRRRRRRAIAARRLARGSRRPRRARSAAPRGSRSSRSRRRRRARSGARSATSSWAPLRRTALRIRSSRIGISCIGSQPTTRIAPAWSMSPIATRQRRAGEAGAERRGGSAGLGGAGHVGRGERAADDPLDQVALLVGGAAADDRGDLARAAPQARRRRGRAPRPSSPASRRAAAAHLRGERPVRAGEHLVAEAALVAEPAVVDLVVVAGEHAGDLLVADGELDVALARAERADRARVLDVPGPGAEAVGLRGQRADGAELDDVAVEGGRRRGGPRGCRRRSSAPRSRSCSCSSSATSWLKRTQR